MSAAVSGAAASAPYGRACLACFRSKCKCVPRPGATDGACERCHRLGKHCTPSDSIRKRRTQQSAAARTEQLEQKIDGIVSLLASVAQSKDSAESLGAAFGAAAAAAVPQPPPPPPPPPPPGSGGAANSVPAAAAAAAAPPRPPPPAVTGVDVPSASSSSSFDITPSPETDLDSQDAAALFNLDPQAAEARLAVFRDSMLRGLPCLHLPPGMSARQLAQHRPFLMRSIIAVTAWTMQEKTPLYRAIKAETSRRMLLQGENSLDLFLGLLVFALWGQDQFVHKTVTLTSMTQLVSSMVFQFRLNKPAPKETYMFSDVTPFDFESKTLETFHGLELPRATMGAFLLSSAVALYFAQSDPLRWTAQMSECLRLLEHNSEFPADRSFALQVRLQRLTQRATHIKWRETDAFTYENEGALHDTPAFYLEILVSQLNEIKRDISLLPEQDSTLMLYMHSTESAVYDMLSSESPIPSTPAGLQRLDSLSKSLLSLKSWIDIFLSMPNHALSGSAFLIHTQFARVVVALFRISRFADPLWSADLARDTLDILVVFDRMEAKIREVAAHVGEGSDDEFLGRTAKMLVMMKGWCASRLPNRDAKAAAAAAAKEDLEMPPDTGFDYGFYNEAWMEDVFGGQMY